MVDRKKHSGISICQLEPDNMDDLLGKVNRDDTSTIGIEAIVSLVGKNWEKVEGGKNTMSDIAKDGVKALRELSERVHIWNLSTWVADLYLTEAGISPEVGRAAAMPAVGLFWLDSNGKVFGFRAPTRDADTYGDFVIYSRSHYEDWGRIQGESVDFRGKQYEDVPRGRVVFNIKKRTFTVFLPCEYRKTEYAEARLNINSFFRLPPSLVRYDYNDEHYQRTDW